MVERSARRSESANKAKRVGESNRSAAEEPEMRYVETRKKKKELV